MYYYVLVFVQLAAVCRSLSAAPRPLPHLHLVRLTCCGPNGITFAAFEHTLLETPFAAFEWVEPCVVLR